MLEELSTQYPKLKPLLSTLKEGFQTTIRNIVANELREKGNRENDRINKQQEDNLTKIQQQFDARGLIIEEQEDIIESKDDVITDLRRENESLQTMLEKHRINGMKLQDENDQLRLEIDRMQKLEEEMLERCEMFESTDQDLAIALKEMREQEKEQCEQRLEKYAKDVPKLNMEKVQEIIRLKCEEDVLDSYEEEEDESSRYDQEVSHRLSENKDYDNKQFYSERNEYEEYGSSEDENVDAKQNIKAILGSLNIKKKSDRNETQKEEKKNLFDYKEKSQREKQELLQQENTIDE